MTVKTLRLRNRLINSAKTDSKRIHITPRDSGWAIRKESNIRATQIVSTQKEAIEVALKIVKTSNASHVIVHSKNGKFRAVN